MKRMLNTKEVKNPFARSNNHVKETVTAFNNSKSRCVEVDASGYSGPAQCQWSVHEGIKHAGLANELETHMYKGKVLLMKSKYTDHSKTR